MERLSYEALARINSFLLVVSGASLAVALAAGAYLLVERGRIREIKGNLLGQQALQEELMQGAKSKHSLYPHIAKDISFVLNPAMKRTTWKGGGADYPINSIGLRGREIGPKPPGTTRIALVGDSVFFGYRLPDPDRLSVIMQSRLDDSFGPGRYEVVTVALPGWNVADQDGFLRRHLSRIDPDYVIWSLMRNDLLDSAGAAPPGVQLRWNAPQKASEQPFQPPLGSGHIKDSPTYSVMARWRDNLRRVEGFEREHGVPVSLLWWQARRRALVDRWVAEFRVELPLVVIPERYRYDEASWCVEPADCHPSRWGNERLAIGLLGELIERGTVDPMHFDAEQKEVLAAFVAECQRVSTPEEQRLFFGEGADRVPERFTLEDARETVLFGVEEGKMGLNGILMLRGRNAERSLLMEIGSLAPRHGKRQEIRLLVRNEAGETAEDRSVFEAERTRMRVELPEAVGFGLYEIEWTFAYSECEAPGACYSARLENAELQ
jgi:hypothetical protein